MNSREGEVVTNGVGASCPESPTYTTPRALLLAPANATVEAALPNQVQLGSWQVPQ